MAESMADLAIRKERLLKTLEAEAREFEGLKRNVGEDYEQQINEQYDYPKDELLDELSKAGLMPQRWKARVTVEIDIYTALESTQEVMDEVMQASYSGSDFLRLDELPAGFDWDVVQVEDIS